MPMTEEQSGVAPTPLADRNLALDVLRGFALLGILVMNVQSFAMIDTAYLNPTSYGDFTGLNRITWLLSHVFADTKFMSLFSLMFGASVLLFTDRVEARGRGPAGLYYRRILWLIVFGLLHAYLLWHGDILYTYGVCALFLYVFRKAPPWVVLVLGFLVLSVSSLLYGFFQWSLPFWDEVGRAGAVQAWNPSPETIAEIETAFRGGWREQMGHRAIGAFFMQTFLFLIMLGWRAGGLMLMGMALYRWKVLTGERSDRFYTGCILAGLFIGVPVVAYGAYRNIAANWSMDYSFFAGMQYNYWGSLLVSLGYVGLIMLACRRAWVPRLMDLLAGVGRTALSNYILQTVICTLIFYGTGLGLFGKVPRYGQFLIVVGIWSFQVLVTRLWLKHFRFGPLEWVWRTLTYWRRQPMRRPAP